MSTSGKVRCFSAIIGVFRPSKGGKREREKERKKGKKRERQRERRELKT